MANSRNRGRAGLRASGTALAAALALCVSFTPLLAQQKEERTVLNERLFEAVRKNDMGTVRSLLTAGADPMARDAAGQTPPGVAINQGYFDVAHYILAVRNQQQASRRPAPDVEADGARPSAPVTSESTQPVRESPTPSWRANATPGQVTEVPPPRLASPREPVVVTLVQPKRPAAPAPRTAVQQPKPAPKPAQMTPGQTAPSPPTRSELTDLPRLPSGAPNPFDPRNSEPTSLPVLGATLSPTTAGSTQPPAAAPAPSVSAPVPPQEPAKPEGRNPLTRLLDGVSGVFSGRDRQDSPPRAVPAAPRESSVAAPSLVRQEPIPAQASEQSSEEVSENPAVSAQTGLNGVADVADGRLSSGGKPLAHEIMPLFSRNASEPVPESHPGAGGESEPQPVAPVVAAAVAPSPPAAVTEAGAVEVVAAERNGLVKSIAALFGPSGPRPTDAPGHGVNVEPSDEPVAPIAPLAAVPSEPVRVNEAPVAGDQPAERAAPIARFFTRLFGRNETATAEEPHAFETAAAPEPTPTIEPRLAEISPLPVIVDPTLTAVPATEPQAPHEALAASTVPPAADVPAKASAQPSGFTGFLRNLFRPASAEAEPTASSPQAAPQTPQDPVQLAALAPITPSVERAPASTSVAPRAATAPLGIGEFTLTRALNDPIARAKNCFQKGKLPGWYCLENIEWPAEIQERMEVDSWLFGRGRIVVHYDNNGAAQILFALFPTEHFNQIVRFLEAQLGPATTDASRRVALIGEPAKLNLMAIWNRRDADGNKTLLEARKFDTVRSMIPDTRVGFLSLSRDGAQPLFRYVSDADLMMQSVRISAGLQGAPAKR